MNRKKPTMLFDLDGTLYQFKEGSFRASKIQQKVLTNAVLYISKKTNNSLNKSKEILETIIQKYGEHISIGLEKELKISRSGYFNTVWNIKATKYISYNPDLNALLTKIKKDFNLVLISDAPVIWINNVLDELKIKAFFEDNVFSGESDNRKDFGNAFDRIIELLGISGNDCIAIGDQEKTDILPAQQIGATTIFINQHKTSNQADYNLKNILDLKNIIPELLILTQYKKTVSDIAGDHILKKFKGSSGSGIFLSKNKIYKIAPEKEALQEAGLYSKFKNALNDYSKIFPECTICYKNNNLAIQVIDYLGNTTFEKKILDSTPHDIIEIKKINKDILQKISLIFNSTKNGDFTQKNLKNLIKIIINNLNKNSFANDFQDMSSFAKHYDLFLKHCQASLTHNDLSVGNILIKKNHAFFIDPRHTVPCGKQQEHGNIAFDLIGYHVSMIRKELELAQQNNRLNLNTINKDIEQYILKYENKAFNPLFKHLCYLHWFSVYCSCACEYCLDKKRKWLYDKMQQFALFHYTTIKENINAQTRIV